MTSTSVCEICGQTVLDYVQGVCKGEGELFHMRCYAASRPPEPIEKDFDPGLPHKDNLYNCGHLIYGPYSVVPPRCPKCDAPLIQLYLDEM